MLKLFKLIIFSFISSHAHVWQNLLQLHVFVVPLGWWPGRSRNMWEVHKWQLIVHYWLRNCRSQWPHGVRRSSAAARLLRLRVLISQWPLMSVCCESCSLYGRGLCDKLITRPVESYWMWCVVVCDLETSWMRRPLSTGGCSVKTKKSDCEVSRTQYCIISLLHGIRITLKVKDFFP